MKTKLFKNLLFVIGALAVIFSVITFNFVVDPYHVFKNKFCMVVFEIPRKYSHIMLKAYKNVPCDTLFLGDSTVHSLFMYDDLYRYFFNQIAIQSVNVDDQYKILKDYLYFHPETKNVNIFLTYPIFVYNTGRPISSLNRYNFNLQELFFLLLSEETTKKSFEEIKKSKKIDFRDYTNKYLPLDEHKYLSFGYYPNISFTNPSDKETVQNMKKVQLPYYEKMISLLKEKNINYRIIIPPYHAIYSSIIYKVPHIQEMIDDIKRMCVELSENDVYDFSVINQYTTQDYDDTNYLYTDFVHPNQILGFKIFKVLHDNYSEKDLYVKLNKENIEQQIKNNHLQVKNFMNKNEKTVSKYTDFVKYTDYGTGCINKDFNGAPDYVTNEIKWYRQKLSKINEMNKQGKELQKGVWKNTI